MELAKDICERFNRLFGELFPIPQNPVFSKSNEIADDSLDYTHKVCMRVMSLQDGKKKMSKSDPSKLSCINLIDDSESIRLKVRRAKTDSLGKVTYDPENRPEISNLL